MSLGKRKRIFRPAHEFPGDPKLDYIILPYGAYYQKTKPFLDAITGDTMRFFNGPDVAIEKVLLVDYGPIVDYLCKMRYGVSWEAVFRKWLDYARLDGNGKDILDKNKCLVIFYNAKVTM